MAKKLSKTQDSTASLREEPRRLSEIITDAVPTSVKNSKTWKYGYDAKYDIVVISKDGTLGDVIEIQNLRIGLPKAPASTYKRSSKASDQYWEQFQTHKELDRIKTIFQWNEFPADFKKQWVEYIETEFDRRENGFWFYNNGTPTYITGTHYMYLQWTKIDVGHPDFRESNRLFYIFWEACNFVDGLQYKIDSFTDNEFNNIVNKVKIEIDLVLTALISTPTVIINKFSSVVFDVAIIVVLNVVFISNSNGVSGASLVSSSISVSSYSLEVNNSNCALIPPSAIYCSFNLFKLFFHVCNAVLKAVIAIAHSRPLISSV